MADASFEPPVDAWADVRGIRIRYRDWKGDGPPILALHGLGRSANWYDLVAPLLRDRYRVVAFDQRGHGQTTQAESGYEWQSLSSDAVGLMDQLRIPNAAVLGHSMGANVAINVAARFPERVQALVMIDGGFSPSTLPAGETWERFIARHARQAPREGLGTRQEFLERMRDDFALCWSEELEGIVQTMIYEDREGQIHDILRLDTHAQVVRLIWHEPVSITWPQISCRTSIIAADSIPGRAADAEFAPIKRRMVGAAAEAIRHVQVRWIPETIHDIAYHKPAKLAGIIREFLSSDPSSGG